MKTELFLSARVCLLTNIIRAAKNLTNVLFWWHDCNLCNPRNMAATLESADFSVDKQKNK